QRGVQQSYGKDTVVLDFVFFFFQAEDGIRDDLVTGVQTCALPIWRSGTRPPRLRISRSSPPHPPGEAPGTIWRSSSSEPGLSRRSEERRVGKEWKGGGGEVDYEAGDNVRAHERTTMRKDRQRAVDQ